MLGYIASSYNILYTVIIAQMEGYTSIIIVIPGVHYCNIRSTSQFNATSLGVILLGKQVSIHSYREELLFDEQHEILYILD